LLANIFTFTSPNDDTISREAYWDVCWVHRDVIANFDLLDIVTTQHTAFVRYNCKLHDGKAFQNVEYMTISNGKVTSVTVYFGHTLAEARE